MFTVSGCFSLASSPVIPAASLHIQSRLQHRLRLPAQSPQTAVWRRPQDEIPRTRVLHETSGGPGGGRSAVSGPIDVTQPRDVTETLCSPGSPLCRHLDRSHSFVCDRTTSHMFIPKRFTTKLLYI